MQDILIIAHFTQAPGEKGNGRFHYIAESINRESAKIEVVTSSFSHKTKMQRVVTSEQLTSISYKFTMLHEPGYKKNVSLKRFYSHFIFGKSLEDYLKKRTKPDVIYCAVPSLDVAYVASKFANENNIKFVIDVQDLWPEAFKMVFRVPVLSNVLFYPMQKKADYIYSAADEIIAVSQTYSDRVLKVNKKCTKAHSVYLGTDLAYFDRLVAENKIFDKPKDEVWLAYIGTLGHSYNIRIVIDALKLLKDKVNIKFIIMGDGPLKSTFQMYARENDINTFFTGRLEYNKMVGILKECDIAVNPISSGAAQSIINKHADYSAAGLPVVSTQECPEYRELIDEYHFGLNCENNNAEDLAKKIMSLYDDISLRKLMGKNSRNLAEEKFDRSRTYKKIVELLN